MRTLLSRIAGVFRQRWRDRELDDEVRFHLEMTAENTSDSGCEPTRRSVLRDVISEA